VRIPAFDIARIEQQDMATVLADQLHHVRRWRQVLNGFTTVMSADDVADLPVIALAKRARRMFDLLTQPILEKPLLIR
jgi:hypothetical protein